MADWGDADNKPDSAAEFYDILANNANRANRHMRIEIAKDGTTFDVDVFLDRQASACYSEDDVPLQSVGTIILQSHWGSGVVFSNMQITPN
jgi:hypothetical protein